MGSLFLLLAVGLGSAAPAVPWTEFGDASAGFSVDLPGEPVEERSSRFTPVGRIGTHEVRAYQGAVEFRVEVHDIPAIARWILSERGILRRAADGLLSDEGAADVETTSGQLAGHPARRVRYRAADGRPCEARFVLANGRLYVRVVLWAVGDRERAGGERFFDSFGLR